jgi:hypothetical protein
MSRVPARAAWALVAAAALCAAGAWAQEASKPSAAALPARSLEPPPGALVAAGGAPDVIFLYTGDVIGYIEPCG